jgi:hypothetical protein
MEATMTDRTRTELIDRYRSGMMSPAEESRFHQELASDARLRRMLEADDLIVGAVRSDLTAAATDHAATQAAVMATLAVASEAARRGIPATSSGRRFPLNGTAAVLKTVAAIVVAGGVVAGVYGLWPDADTVKSPAPAVESVRSTPAPVTQPSESTVAEPAPTVQERSAAPAQHPSVTTETTTERTPRAAGKKSGTENTAPSLAPVTTEPHDIEQSAKQQEKREIPVRKKDSVRLKIEVKDKE